MTALGPHHTRLHRSGPAGITAVLDVLDTLDRLGPVTLAELARATGIAKSTLHRVCLTMADRGWIARDGAGYLALGPRVAWLARATPGSALTAGFHVVAQRVLARHNETTCLAVLEGRDSVFIAKEETSHWVRLITAVGSRLPAFASASGRVLLADRPEADVDSLHAEAELVTPTGRRIDGLPALRAILDRARERRYAENIDETALGLHCIAVPIGPPGRVAAAITMCVPSGRMTPGRREEMIADLWTAAEQLAKPGQAIQSTNLTTPVRTAGPTVRRNVDSNRKATA